LLAARRRPARARSRASPGGVEATAWTRASSSCSRSPHVRHSRFSHVNSGALAHVSRRPAGSTASKTGSTASSSRSVRMCPLVSALAAAARRRMRSGLRPPGLGRSSRTASPDARRSSRGIGSRSRSLDRMARSVAGRRAMRHGAAFSWPGAASWSPASVGITHFGGRGGQVNRQPRRG
jgi:hypothetical protein